MEPFQSCATIWKRYARDLLLDVMSGSGTAQSARKVTLYHDRIKVMLSWICEEFEAVEPPAHSRASPVEWAFLVGCDAGSAGPRGAPPLSAAPAGCGGPPVPIESPSGRLAPWGTELSGVARATTLKDQRVHCRPGRGLPFPAELLASTNRRAISDHPHCRSDGRAPFGRQHRKDLTSRLCM